MAWNPMLVRTVFEKMFLARFLHSSRMNMASSPTAPLAKLRKMTGYSMSNCKKALELHPEDITKAEEWLHEEAKKQGWSKIANLEHRPAVQGLVGICIRGSDAAMVEVNCETDFVARNAEFQAFVSKILTTCLENNINTVAGDCDKSHIDGNQLSNLKTDSGTLGDLNASAVGKFGEKTVIRRGVCLKVGQGIFLSSFSHPSVDCPDLPGATLGKYGGIVAFRPTKTCQEFDRNIIQELGKQLCQHIVGMNPESIGTMPPDEPEKPEDTECNEDYGVKLKVEDMKEDIIIGEQQDNEHHDDEETSEDKEKAIDANETQLLRQQFLIDPDLTVGKLLQNNSLEVLNFQRFECGEVIVPEAK